MRGRSCAVSALSNCTEIDVKTAGFTSASIDKLASARIANVRT